MKESLEEHAETYIDLANQFIKSLNSDEVSRREELGKKMRELIYENNDLLRYIIDKYAKDKTERVYIGRTCAEFMSVVIEKSRPTREDDSNQIAFQA